MKKGLLVLMMSSCILTSCVDSNYDLGNVNTDDITFGDAWNLPLGKGSVTTEDFINVNESDIQIDENGAYYARYEGSLQEPDMMRSHMSSKNDSEKKLVAIVDISTEGLNNMFEGDFVLALSNPHMKIKSGLDESGSDYPLDCMLKMTSYGIQEEVSTSSDFTLKAATPNVWLGPIQPEQTLEYNFVENTDIPKLIQVIPNRMFLELWVNTDQTAIVPPSTFGQMQYSVELPFVPAKEFKATSAELIENAFDEDLIEYIFSNGNVEIYGEMKNELPFDLAVKMQILDAQRQDLGIDIPAQEVKGKEGNIVFKITKEDMPKMETARHINLLFTLSGRDQNEALKQGQKVEMSLKLKKEGGISI